MATTYSGNPGASTKDELRFLVGDTGAAVPMQLTDEEINWQYSKTTPGIGAAAIALVRRLMALNRSLVDQSVGDISISYSQRLAALEATLNELIQDPTLGALTIGVGGVTRQQIVEQNSDPNAVQPPVKRDQFTMPGTNPYRASWPGTGN